MSHCSHKFTSSSKRTGTSGSLPVHHLYRQTSWVMEPPATGGRCNEAPSQQNGDGESSKTLAKASSIISSRVLVQSSDAADMHNENQKPFDEQSIFRFYPPPMTQRAPSQHIEDVGNGAAEIQSPQHKASTPCHSMMTSSRSFDQVPVFFNNGCFTKSSQLTGVLGPSASPTPTAVKSAPSRRTCLTTISSW